MIKFCILTYDNKSVETFDNDLNCTFCNADYKWVFHEISFDKAKDIAKNINAESIYARFYNNEGTCVDMKLAWCDQLSEEQNENALRMFEIMREWHSLGED